MQTDQSGFQVQDIEFLEDLPRENSICLGKLT